MSRKNLFLLVLSVFILGLALAVVFFACDMSYVPDDEPDDDKDRNVSEDDIVDLTDDERDELEKNGHFLKVINMPLNTQITNISSVQVSNSVSIIGRFNNMIVYRYLENDSCTIYIPLVYNDNSEFTETGSFITAFQIIVDAVTIYKVELSDKFLVPFVNGRGTVDINLIPGKPLPTDINVLEAEAKDELERTGRFLKLTHMPANTQITNVSSVIIANSVSSIAKFNNAGKVWLFIEEDFRTIYIPLVYNNNSEFTETGSFFVSFQIVVDAVTMFKVELSDKFLVSFINGQGTVDVRTLPGVTASYQSYLTIYNLPVNLSQQNISDVALHNQAGRVAYCSDYSLVDVSISENKATARIPLFNNNANSVFIETGFYFVSFEINIDVSTRFLVDSRDQVVVSFVNGNGFFNIDEIPEKAIPPVSYLTITGLPEHTTKSHISEVVVYNIPNTVAQCNNNNNIVISYNGGYVAAQIPLSSGSGWFADTGMFVVSFTINVDALTQISFKREDSLMLPFVNGSASFDINSTFGHFSAELVNPNDSAAPRIRSGSSFDIDGLIHRVTGETSINSFFPSYSCVVYVYAYRLDSGVFYEYSTQTPVYSTVKKGFYNGSKRALWVMFYFHETGQFVFKSHISSTDNSFPHLGYVTLSNSEYNSIIASSSPVFSLAGANNPASVSLTLQPGIYAIKLIGAGGGGGFGAVRDSSVSGSSSGGAGGVITEVFSVKAPVSFTAFTGSGGYAPPEPSPSGTFSIKATKNIILLTGSLGSHTISNSYTNTVLDSLFASFSSTSGGGGGGGGSGSFLYSADGYFLVAGGGGGGSGASWLTPGGGGGVGGTIGPGSGGGAAGYFQQFSGGIGANLTASGGHGGNGGGNSGSSGGQSTSSSSNRTGGSVASVLYSNTTVPGGSGTSSYSSSSFNVPSFLINNLKRHVMPGPNSINMYSGEESDLPPLSFDLMSYSISADSGSGGSAQAVSHPSGPVSWLNTVGVEGTGGSAQALNSVYFSGSFSVNSFTYNSGTPYDTLPASFSVWTAYTSSLSFTLGALRNGVNGSSGGNNRNASKGGGAAAGGVSNSRPTAGGAGSVVIYKIY